MSLEALAVFIGCEIAILYGVVKLCNKLIAMQERELEQACP